MAADVAGFAFCVEFRYVPGEVIVAVRGELDALSSPACAAVIDAGVSGQRYIVLDLGAVTFFGAAGLHLVADLAHRAHQDGGVVEVRAASPLIREMLQRTDVGTLVTMTDSADDAAATEQRALRSRETDTLAGTLAEVLVPLTHDVVVDAALGMLATIAQALIADLAAASVTMRRREQFATVAATDPVARDLDETQYGAGHGPCVQAVLEARAIHAYPDGDTPAAWAAIRHAANPVKIRGVLSTPLGDPPFGALNLYSHSGTFSAADRALVSLLTGQAPTVFDIEQVPRARLRDRLRDALASRDVIALAQGRLMERDHISADNAHGRLRRGAVATVTPLHRYADTIVNPPDPDAS